MSLMAAAVRVAEETEFDPDTVSPGVAGFFALAALAVGIILLGFNLVRRLRRNSYRADVREQIEQEIAERDGHADAASEPPVDPAAGPGRGSDLDPNSPPRS